jgi:hypothetical protein
MQFRLASILWCCNHWQVYYKLWHCAPFFFFFWEASRSLPHVVLFYRADSQAAHHLIPCKELHVFFLCFVTLSFTGYIVSPVLVCIFLIIWVVFKLWDVLLVYLLSFRIFTLQYACKDLINAVRMGGFDFFFLIVIAATNVAANNTRVF